MCLVSGTLLHANANVTPAGLEVGYIVASPEIDQQHRALEAATATSGVP